MLKRCVGALCVALLIALVWGTSARADVVVPLPGLAGDGLALPAAQRTDTGGGILVARSGTGVMLARVQADGAPDLAYGTRGVAHVNVPSGFNPTVLTVDPATGTAWIAGVTATHVEIAAVSGTGATLTSFGRHGTLTLPAGTRAVRSLSWRTGRLLVADVSSGCDGCQLSELSPITGRRLATITVTAGQLRGSCSTLFDTGAVWSGSNILLATAADGSRCRAQTLELPARPGVGAFVTPPAPVKTQAIQLAAGDGQICEAGSGITGVTLWGAGQPRVSTLSHSDSADLLAVVPIGQGACGGLLREPGGAAAVFQIATGGAAAARTKVPSTFDAMTMYRCNAHLLVVGTVRGTAMILAVPLSRGPYVARTSARSASAEARGATLARTTGCT